MFRILHRKWFFALIKGHVRFYFPGREPGTFGFRAQIANHCAKHTLKILGCSHRKIFKVCLPIFQHYK